MKHSKPLEYFDCSGSDGHAPAAQDELRGRRLDLKGTPPISAREVEAELRMALKGPAGVKLLAEVEVGEALPFLLLSTDARNVQRVVQALPAALLRDDVLSPARDGKLRKGRLP